MDVETDAGRPAVSRCGNSLVFTVAVWYNYILGRIKQMIGIIGAMEVEIAGLMKRIQEPKGVTAGRITVISGMLNGVNVSVCRCGIGKVNAAAAATLMIERFPAIELIINLGVAGGIKPGIRQGDFVVAGAAIQHDYDLTPDGLTRGQVAGYESREFACCKVAANKMCAVLANLGYRYEKGVIASGDQFIESKEKACALYREFVAYACDMETAAVAHVCDLFGKRFLGIRSMSDNADGGAVEDFYSFVEKAAERSINAVCAFLEG